MAFTYNPALTTDLAKVRFAIGDTVESSGPKPDASNYQDAEINAIVTQEGSWQAAVVYLMRNLAILYSPEAQYFKIMEWTASHGDTSEKWTLRADAFEMRFGLSGLVSWRSTDDDGDAFGKMFGHEQWGADPVDYGA